MNFIRFNSIILFSMQFDLRVDDMGEIIRNEENRADDGKTQEKLYKSGEFAKKAHITKKTLRYYDEHNILRPSLVNESGARFYSERDFAKLQQILFLKYLSFSLAEIKEMTLRNDDLGFWEESLDMQTNLLNRKIEQLSLMNTALEDAKTRIREGKQVDFGGMLDAINMNEMEEKLKKQYQNSSNISARIRLHKDFSTNHTGWFPWIYEKAAIQPGEKILELGCGDGSFWVENMAHLPERIEVTLTDYSNGILWEAEKQISCSSPNFCKEVMDAHHINASENSFDVIIANHVLFYCEDLSKVFSEVLRTLKPGGRFICSTYSGEHMKEVSNLVREFDDRIALSADILYEKFGKENGGELLGDYFEQIQWFQYEDGLLVDKPEPLIAYILSCHGNQNRFIVDHYPEFYSFVKKYTDRGFKITKDAGIFIGYKIK